jgi:hypothetical protein
VREVQLQDLAEVGGQPGQHGEVAPVPGKVDVPGGAGNTHVVRVGLCNGADSEHAVKTLLPFFIEEILSKSSLTPMMVCMSGVLRKCTQQMHEKAVATLRKCITISHSSSRDKAILLKAYGRRTWLTLWTSAGGRAYVHHGPQGRARKEGSPGDRLHREKTARQDEDGPARWQ